MKRTPIRKALTLLVCVGAPLLAASGPTVTSKIDSIFAPLADDTTSGLAVLVRKNGRTIFQRGYGVRDCGSSWTASHQIQDADVLDLLKRQTHGKFTSGTSWPAWHQPGGLFYGPHLSVSILQFEGNGVISESLVTPK